MRKKTVFSTSMPPMYGLALAVLCAAALLTPASGQTWTQASPANYPGIRESHAMAYDAAHGQVVLFGGTAGTGLVVIWGDTWVWDGANWSLKEPSTSPSPRFGHAMAYDSAHGQVVLFGGNSGNSSLHNDTWVWDGTNWTQKFPATNPPARFFFSMAYDAVHGQVVMFGGANGTTDLGDTWTWDGTNWTQRSPNTSPSARASQAMAFDSLHGQVVMFGGNSGNYLFDTWVWDGTTWTLKSPATSPAARQGHAMAYDSAHGEVVLFGGVNSNSMLGDTWVWDGINWNPESSSGAPPARVGHAMAYDAASGQVVLFGGFVTTFADDTWVWHRDTFANWAQQLPATSPSARIADAMAYDSLHSQMVLFGGFNGGATRLSDTWVWDGINWTLKSPSTSPPGRSSFGMAFDSAHNQVVLFGGVGSAFFNDTWVWDGANWTQKTPTNSPPARSAFAMAYDAAHGQVVLFGGESASLSSLGDTWVWDGTNWNQRFPSTSPSPRTGHAMAYDAARQQVVLFGGGSDTWVWDGTNWTQKAPTTIPPSRSGNAMAFDAAHQQVFMFGGYNGSYLGDTWGWDGTNWTRKSSDTNPAPREFFAMGYDAAHRQIVVLGGFQTFYLSDTWIWEAMSVSPNSGSGDGPQVFSAGYFDNNGASDLQVVYLDFGSVGDAPHNCKVAYAQSGSTLFLFNDANNGVVGSIVLGGGGSLSNSECTLFGGSTPATISGDQLLVPFDIQFLGGYGGLKTIFGVAQTYGGIQSDNGVFETLGSWTPAVSIPGVVSVTPNSGSGTGPQIFSAVYSDTGGANDLQAVYLDFGSVGGFAPQNCIVVYTPGLNQLYLFNDSNTGALGPITLGAGGGTLSNSQCTLSSGTTPATLSGINLTIPFDITFKSGYGGKKFIFGLSQTYAGAQSNGGAQTQLGTWEPATSTPSAVSVTPNSGVGSGPQVFTAGYSDSGGANDLQVVYLSFSTTTFLAANSCNMGYEPGNNTLFLFSDNNATIATVGEDGAGSVSNSQCTLSGGSSAASESGIGLTVPFTLTFMGGFLTHDTKVFGLAQTYDGTQSAITTLGSWLP